MLLVLPLRPTWRLAVLSTRRLARLRSIRHRWSSTSIPKQAYCDVANLIRRSRQDNEPLEGGPSGRFLFGSGSITAHLAIGPILKWESNRGRRIGVLRHHRAERDARCRNGFGICLSKQSRDSARSRSRRIDGADYGLARGRLLIFLVPSRSQF
jgi:hypothetical protein